MSLLTWSIRRGIDKHATHKQNEVYQNTTTRAI